MTVAVDEVWQPAKVELTGLSPATQVLSVTTYGIDAYSQAQLEANPATILARTPTIVSAFRVTPVLLPDPEPEPERRYLPLVQR
ncbi:MAG: hypothetical protein AB4911_24215 [Oscillochloridaceae bacterium umkhey_bin13]